MVVIEETLVADPKRFRVLVGGWRCQPTLWVDTEVADWFTATPRLSLLQVQDGSGRVVVIDVLSDSMRSVLEKRFIPEVMANASVAKWAHYARFERRFLGQERVANLNCAFEMAKAIPYYRLPVRSLSLSALVEHFFGLHLDKTLQKADWGVRPLSPAHIEYAAADPVWCHRLHDRLQGIPRPPEAFQDDAHAIQARYHEILCPFKKAKAVRVAIRDPVKELMVRRHLVRLSRFALQMRTTYSTSLTALVEFALTSDPAGYFDLGIPLSARLRSLLGSDIESRLRPRAEIRMSQSFRGPRTPRAYVPSIATYKVREADVERVTRDYEVAEHNTLTLASERAELRDRMKQWMQRRGLAEWGEFYFSEPSVSWRVDARALKGMVPGPALQVAFPQRLWLAFQEQEFQSLIDAGQSQETPVLRWLPRALSVGPQAQESRDWEDSEEDDDRLQFSS